MTKQEWMKGEVNKWVTRMKEDINYDETIHSRKAFLLYNWMKKTFNSISMKNVKQLLYDCESELETSIMKKKSKLTIHQTQKQEMMILHQMGQRKREIKIRKICFKVTQRKRWI